MKKGECGPILLERREKKNMRSSKKKVEEEREGGKEGEKLIWEGKNGAFILSGLRGRCPCPLFCASEEEEKKKSVRVGVLNNRRGGGSPLEGEVSRRVLFEGKKKG